MTNMTANDTVSNVVLAELERRGMTRAEFGRLMGQERGWVTHKLNGHRRWSVDDLDLLAERLELPLAALLMAPAPVRGVAPYRAVWGIGERLHAGYEGFLAFKHHPTTRAA